MNITVFAGAAEGKKKEYMEAAASLGKWIGEKGHNLVYGDGKVGMMGEVARATLAAGGTVTGIIPQFMVITLVAGLISQLGDLAASAIKRDRDIKDYGRLIPGHGGIMDRFDSVIFVTPFIYGLVVFIMK